jgi:integrase/recombinase XerD
MPDNIYKRGSIWWGRATLAGREHKVSLHTNSRAEALKRVRVWKDRIDEARFYGEATHTYIEAVVRWQREYLPHSVRKGTARRYITSLRMLNARFSELTVNAVTKKQIAAYISERTGQGVSNATIRRDLTALSSILSCCVGWGWLDSNPAKEFDRSIIKERRELPTLPTWYDIATAIQGCPEMMGRLLLVLYQTGMRLNEAGALEHNRINYMDNTAVLFRTKNGQPRAVPLGEGCLATLRSTPRHLCSEAVFWHSVSDRYGNQIASHYRNLSTNLAKIIRASKNTFRVHDLRHRFAVDWIERCKAERGTVDLYALQQIMGHSSIKVTEGYLRFRLLPENWPHKPLHSMSYAEVMRFKLPPRTAQNAAQVQRFSRKNDKAINNLA